MSLVSAVEIMSFGRETFFFLREQTLFEVNIIGCEGNVNWTEALRIISDAYD